MCLKKYYRLPEAMPKFLPFLDLAKVTFWTKGFVLEKTIKPLGVAGGYVQFYRMDVCDLEHYGKGIWYAGTTIKTTSQKMENWHG